MSFGFGIGDILHCSEYAVKAYSALKSAPKEFDGLRLEVLSLRTTLNALADEATSGTTIIHYTPAQRRDTLRLLLENCANGLAQLNEFLLKYPSVKKGAMGKDRVIFAGHTATQAIQSIRDKLAIHTVSINIFLTSLTHASLGRLELELQKTLRFGLASHASLPPQAGGFGIMDIRDPNQSTRATADDGFDGIWLSIGQELALSDITKRNVEEFQGEVKEYIRHLVRGGMPYWKKAAPIVPPKPNFTMPEKKKTRKWSFTAVTSKLIGRGAAPESKFEGQAEEDAYSEPLTPREPFFPSAAAAPAASMAAMASRYSDARSVSTASRSSDSSFSVQPISPALDFSARLSISSNSSKISKFTKQRDQEDDAEAEEEDDAEAEEELIRLAEDAFEINDELLMSPALYQGRGSLAIGNTRIAGEEIPASSVEESVANPAEPVLQPTKTPRSSKPPIPAKPNTLRSYRNA